MSKLFFVPSHTMSAMVIEPTYSDPLKQGCYVTIHPSQMYRARLSIDSILRNVEIFISEVLTYKKVPLMYGTLFTSEEEAYKFITNRKKVIYEMEEKQRA